MQRWHVMLSETSVTLFYIEDNAMQREQGPVMSGMVVGC